MKLLLLSLTALCVNAATIDTTQIWVSIGVQFTWHVAENGVDYYPVALDGTLVNEITLGILPQVPMEYAAFVEQPQPPVEPPPPVIDPPIIPTTPEVHHVITPESNTGLLMLGAVMVLAGWKKRRT